MDVQQLKQLACGRWPEIFVRLGGVNESVLDGKHHPCLKCGGHDRFRMVDRDAGALLCNQCFCRENGDGLAALQWLNGWSFPEACKRLGEYLGTTPKASKPEGTKSDKPKRVYPTADQAISQLEQWYGPAVMKWEYHDAAGEPVGVVLRWNLPDGNKELRPVSKHGDGWQIAGMPTPRPLYRLPDLATAEVVYVTEGEKAADAARALGLVATTSTNGAKSAKQSDWTPLSGKHIVILPDNDNDGRTYKSDVVKLIGPTAASVRVVELPGLPEAGDIVDWLAAGGTRERLDELVGAAEAVQSLHDASAGGDGYGPVLICFGDIEPTAVEWLWRNRIPLGRLSLLVGKPGEGKSFLTTDMAARVSTGTNWPDDSRCDKGSVIFIACEDDPSDTVRPRLDAASADVRNVHLLSGVKRPGTESEEPEEIAFNLGDVESLEAALRQVPSCKLVIVDPLGSFIPGKVDQHRDNEVRSVLAPVARLAEKYGPAILLVAHSRKGGAADADESALGSRGFVGIARAVWHLLRDPDNHERRLLLPGKNNLAKQQEGLAFTIVGEPGRIEWETKAVKMTANEVIAKAGKAPGPEPTARHEAEAFLIKVLANGNRLAKNIFLEAESEGFSQATLRRAKDKLGIESFQPVARGPWYWRMPGSELASKVEGAEYADESAIAG